MSIFVSIAAYRDPELGPTVRDCIATAHDPASLRFGICWQHAAEERRPPELDDPRVRLIDVDWRDSRGTCWARAESARLYQGEDHVLQLDSHHRFAKHWDAQLLEQLEQAESPRPVLTAYLPEYSPAPGMARGGEPTQIEFGGFTDDGLLSLRPGIIPNWRARTRPVRARFASAHFLFARGQFLLDVPYDPELYFIGEETMLAVRAFTHGYDLFHPVTVVLWHEYSRSWRQHLHWTDHDRGHGVATEWHEYDAQSREKIRRFLQASWIGPDGCGDRRTFAEYEAYAGISFRDRHVHEDARRALEPDGVSRWDVTIRLDRALLPTGAEAAGFWYVGIHDAQGNELHRQDLVGEEIRDLLAASGPEIAIERTLDCDREPATWTIWPCVTSHTWLDPVRGRVHGTARRLRLGRSELRASDRDRDAVAEALAAHAAAGRLDPDELEERVSIALGARTLAELEEAVADLPRRAQSRRWRHSRPLC
jgi:hypothetical protein